MRERKIVLYNFRFRFKPARFDDEFIGRFSKTLDDFFNALTDNGLIMEKWRSSTVMQDCCESVVAAFDIHSLDEKNFSANTRIYLSRLIKMCSQTPQLEYIGINADLESSCKCEKPSGLVMYADLDAQISPVLCCDCQRGFPLRRFRLGGSFEDFGELLDWRRLYRSFRTQYRSGIGEAFAFMMLARPDSQLSVMGRDLAERLEDSSGIVVYYYVLTDERNDSGRCPSCGKPWVSEYPDALGFEYCCQDCRLVSNPPPKRPY